MNKNYYSKTAERQFCTKKDVTKTNFRLNSYFGFALLLLSLFAFEGAWAQYTDNIPGTRTFTVPCDVTSITVQAWGAGGAGGAATANPSGGSGGGGGGYSTYTVAVTAGQIITYTIGTGGVGGGGNGGNGGNTTILALTANGGNGGGLNQGPTGTGGVASGGTANTTGANGGPGTTASGAAGGNCLGAGGGLGGVLRTTTGIGNAGASPGGGGGGGMTTTGTNRNGGSGGNGQISITFSSTLPSCVPTFTTGIEPITNVTFAGINNTTTNVTGGASLQTFCSPTATVVQGSNNTISVKGNTVGNFLNNFRVYFDWNKNGTYGDVANEIYDLGSITNSTGIDAITLTGNISVPITATVGTTSMRVMKRYNAYPTGPCQTGAGYGQAEDYIVNVTLAPPCVASTAQPTALSLSPTGTYISGSFSPASPAPDNYLVVWSISNIAPIPANGTTYTVGSTVGAGYTVASVNNSTTFIITGLANLTTYYVYIFSYNSLCSGGPLYNIISPLTGFATTNTLNYCLPSVSAGLQSQNYINQANFIGNIVNTNNSSTFSSAPNGYQDFTGLGTRATQAQAEGVNIFVNTLGGANYMKAWVDWNKDGLFDDTTEIVYQCSNPFINTTFGFKIPIAAVAGIYRIRLRINKFTAASDNVYTSCGNIANNGETEDYLFTVIDACPAKISGVTPNFNCGAGTVTLGSVGNAGTTLYNWYDAEIGGTLVGTSTTNSWTTPSISTTTTYYVTAFNGTCESLFRSPVKATIKQVPGLSFANATPKICGENSIIDVQATGNNEQVFIIDENFETGLGTFTNNNIASPDVPKTSWQVQSSPYVPQYPTFPVWYPAISSGITGNKFAMSTSDLVAGGNVFGKVEHGLESATVNTTTFVNLTLSFDMYFSSYYDLGTPTQEVVIVETKIGAGAWTAVPTAQYTTDVGIGTQFVTQTYNMAAYMGNAVFQVRIRYKSSWCDGVAIDDIKLFGDRPLSPFFTYSGGVNAFTDAAATIPYTGTPAPIIYLKPTLTQLELPFFSIIAAANLTNGCTTSGTINVTNNTKIWKGTTNNDWNTASNWSTGIVPTNGTCVIIPASTPQTYLNTGVGGLGKNLLIKNGGTLEVQGGNSLTIKEIVIVENTGTLNIKDSGSLIQIDNLVNTVTGTFNMERITQPMNLLDYTYWSSPLSTVTPFTLGNLSSTSPLFYNWVPNFSATTGNWVATGSGTTLTPGLGYIVRAPNTYNPAPGAKISYTANFIGVPNNGNVPTPIIHGSDPSNKDNWNLLGNPYPSAISAQKFLSDPVNTPLIDGTVYFWTHNTAPSVAIPDPFYDDFVINYTLNDYASWNLSGGTGTTASSGGPTPNGNITAGQSFFVKSLGVQASGTNAIFNNGMRQSATYNNSQFFKQTNPKSNNSVSSDELEKHRIWLNFTNNSGAFSQILLAYIEGASVGWDRGFDGTRFSGNNLTFYSLIPGNSLAIQGKPLPFENTDEVILGYNSQTAGNFSIRIDHLDGLFVSQNIYLEDKLLNITHNLKNAPYTFSTSAGIINDRFVLKYSENILANNTFDYSNEVKIFASNEIKISSKNKSIKEVLVYDVLGKTLIYKKNVDKNDFSITELKPTKTILIVKVTLDNGNVKTEKLIF